MERTARWFLLTGPYCIFERLLREYIFKVLATQKKVTLWGYGCVKSPSCGNYFAVYKITMLCTLNVHNAIFQWYLNDARGIEYWTYKISLENLLVGRNGWLVTFAGPKAWIYLIYCPMIFFFFASLHAMGKFPGQGLNPNQGSDLSHSSGWTTWELPFLLISDYTSPLLLPPIQKRLSAFWEFPSLLFVVWSLLLLDTFPFGVFSAWGPHSHGHLSLNCLAIKGCKTWIPSSQLWKINL